MRPSGRRAAAYFCRGAATHLAGGRGLLHDVGKIGVPESILNKPGSLIPGEFATIQHHPVQGYEIVKKIDHPFAEEVAAAVRTHHERWDGRGYPDKLEANNISQVARILTVADAFDAMTSSRAYRKGLNPDEAVRRLKECSGSQFDPDIVAAFDTVYKKGTISHYMETGQLENIDRFLPIHHDLLNLTQAYEKNI